MVQGGSKGQQEYKVQSHPWTGRLAESSELLLLDTDDTDLQVRWRREVRETER